MFKRLIFIVSLFFFGTLTASAEENNTQNSLSEGIPGIISDLKPYLTLRPRYEAVQVSNSPRRDANALTLKTAAGLKVNKILNIDGFRGHIEVTNVAVLGNTYDSSSALGGNNRTQYQVVIDPPITRLTQGYASYSFSETTLTAGRKIVTMDDHRHIGSVGWR